MKALIARLIVWVMNEYNIYTGGAIEEVISEKNRKRRREPVPPPDVVENTLKEFDKYREEVYGMMWDAYEEEQY